jgi:hypothetical protein
MRSSALCQAFEPAQWSPQRIRHGMKGASREQFNLFGHGCRRSVFRRRPQFLTVPSGEPKNPLSGLARSAHESLSSRSSRPFSGSPTPANRTTYTQRECSQGGSPYKPPLPPQWSYGFAMSSTRVN